MGAVECDGFRFAYAEASCEIRYVSCYYLLEN